MSVLVLRPGEMSGTAVSDTPAPLGSVLVLEAADADPHLATVADAQQHSPWMPLAIVGSDDAAARLQHTLRLIIGPVGAVHLSPTDNPGDMPTAIRAAVRKRSVRLPDDVVWYCRRRLDQDTSELVRAALAGADHRSLRRRLQLCRSASPGLWRRRMTVLQGLNVAWQLGWSEAGVARKIGVNSTTLSRNCRRCFGMSWTDLVALGCWEAAVEQGIRCDGHVLSEETGLTVLDTL